MQICFRYILYIGRYYKGGAILLLNGNLRNKKKILVGKSGIADRNKNEPNTT